MTTCFEIARYFLTLVEDDSGEGISNLKLQKLVYYAQGFHLALYSQPLFSEAIEAWMHGPVVPELYKQYKEYGAMPIPKPTDVDLSVYDAKTKELLNDVYVTYGQFSAWKLRELTHEEPTWKNSYTSQNKIISHEEMISYFKTLVNG